MGCRTCEYTPLGVRGARTCVFASQGMRDPIVYCGFNRRRNEHTESRLGPLFYKVVWWQIGKGVQLRLGHVGEFSNRMQVVVKLSVK